MNANEAWIAMFHRIPAALQDAMAIGLTTGAEIVVQKIVKLEQEFMIVRGRLAGTQDTGRIVLIPYIQLTFVGITHAMKDSEVEAVFGKGGAPLSPEYPTEGDQAGAEPGEPGMEDATVIEEAPAVNTPKKPAPISKSVLVARMRDRLKDPGSAGK